MSQRRMVRRDFITAGVLGFPSIIPAGALGLNGKVPPSDRIVMGGIGLGGMGTGDMRMFLQKDEVRMVAMCDVREDRRNRAKQVVDSKYGDKSCATYNDFRELLSRSDIDAVTIATGENWHPLISIEAARRGKHMYQEKPVGVCIAEGKALRDSIRRYGVKFQFGTQQRSSFNYWFTCELIRNGRIGQLKEIQIASNGGNRAGWGWPGRIPPQPPEPVPAGVDWDMWLGPAPYAPYTAVRISQIWMMISDYGLGHIGGVWGVHDVDFAQWANNTDHTTPLVVEGCGLYHNDIRDTAYVYDIEYRYANGVRLHYWDMATAGRRQPLFKDPRGPGSMASIFIGTEGLIYVSRGGIFTEPRSVMRTGVGPNDRHVIKSMDHRQNLLDSIRTGADPVSPIDAAVHADMICHQGDIACRTQRKLRWNPIKEEFIGDAAANRMLSRPMRSPWRLDVPDKESATAEG